MKIETLNDYINDARMFASLHGGACLSDKCATKKSKVSWKCKNGHTWDSVLLNNLRKNQWCKKCAALSQRKTISDCNGIAIKNGGKCLSTEYSNNFDKLKWLCGQGHIWLASFNKISIGRWCPYCSKKVRHTIDVAKKIAEERGGKCLSNTYINLKGLLKWQCGEGHMWLSDLNNIKNHNKWCRACASGKSQRLLASIIQDIYSCQVYNNFKGFDWLKTTKNYRQEIDIWVPDLKLAIEYDGEQHFNPIRFGGISLAAAKANVAYIKKMDSIKNKKIKEHKSDVHYFIRFGYLDELTKPNILEKLIKNNIPVVL